MSLKLPQDDTKGYLSKPFRRSNMMLVKGTKSKRPTFTKKQKHEIKVLATRTIAPEVKYSFYLVVPFGTTNGPAGALHNCTADIAQNSNDAGGRIGDSIKIKDILFDYVVYGNQTEGAMTPQAPQAVRVIIFQWFPNSADYPPNTLKVINGVTGLYGPQLLVASYTKDYEGQYHIMYDCVHTLIFNADYQYQHRKLVLIPPRKSVQYSNGSVNSTNSVWVLVLNDQANGTTTPPLMCYHTRVNYIDA